MTTATEMIEHICGVIAEAGATMEEDAFPVGGSAIFVLIMEKVSPKVTSCALVGTNKSDISPAILEMVQEARTAYGNARH